MAAPDNKQGFLANLSPWGSRAATPKPPQTPRTTESGADDDAKAREREAAVLGRQRGGDHVVDRRHRLSQKRYPQDCPPLAVRWYHAVDVPKRKPLSAHGLAPDASLPKAKKWIPFSKSDSAAVETAFQKTADAADAAETKKGSATPTTPDKEGTTAEVTTTKGTLLLAGPRVRREERDMVYDRRRGCRRESGHTARRGLLEGQAMAIWHARGEAIAFTAARPAAVHGSGLGRRPSQGAG
jgi:hypothetical protein